MRLFLAGLAVTMGNPKVMVFYLALLPSLIDLQAVTLVGWLELSLVTLSVLAVVFGSYVLLAARTCTLFTSPRAIRMVNRGTGCGDGVSGGGHGGQVTRLLRRSRQLAIIARRYLAEAS